MYFSQGLTQVLLSLLVPKTVLCSSKMGLLYLYLYQKDSWYESSYKSCKNF